MILDLDPTLYEQVTAVLPGKYSDVNQFIDAAVRNQLALETQPGHRVNVLTARGRSTENRGAASALSKQSPEPTLGDEARSESSGDGGAGETDQDWRELLTSNRVSVDGLAEPVVIDSPEAVLWGQTNRVLPIVVGVRVLAHLTQARHPNGSVPRSEWSKAAVRSAQALRSELEVWDRVAGRKRGELWATALPAQDPASESRYIGQFLGYVRRDGRVEGGAAFLDLVAFAGDEGDSVALTTAGARLVAFKNPIFDQESQTTRFSREEVDWLLHHIKTYRPSEYRLLAQTAALVNEGRTRTEIDVALSHAHPSWSHYIETMRAGVLGRLSDLGLLGRTRRGLEVDYHMTALATDLGLLEEAEAI